jgi:hypothetical protein
MNTHARQLVLPRELVLAEQLTSLLDDRFRVPVIGIRFGLDPLLGFIPWAGDILSASVSLLILSAFMRHGVPKRLIAKMVFNIILDLDAWCCAVPWRPLRHLLQGQQAQHAHGQRAHFASR